MESFSHSLQPGTRHASADIEDKGTSGETFLAAVEYLEQEQPAVALFENVDKAPWEKMQEYIRGRLNLKERNSIKNITEIKKENAGECDGAAVLRGGLAVVDSCVCVGVPASPLSPP